MKAMLGIESAIVKRVSSSKKETSAKVYLPKGWDGRLVAIIPLFFEGETELRLRWLRYRHDNG
jgi:hypothetical protein